MFAIIAAILFGVALVLHLLSTRADIAGDLVIGGLLCVALHLILVVNVPWKRG